MKSPADFSVRPVGNTVRAWNQAMGLRMNITVASGPSLERPVTMRGRWLPIVGALLCGVCAACQGSGEPAGGAPPADPAAATSAAPQKSTARMATDIPPAITMPDTVQTRLGTLAFKDGFPDDATVQKVYDNLDFQRGVQALLTTLPAASQNAMRRGIRSFGPDNQTVIIFESLMDSRSLFLTANTESL